MTARAKYETVSDAEGAFQFLNSHFKLLRTEGSKGIVLKRDGHIIAACLYEGFNKHNVFMHCAGEPGRKWLNRNFLYWAFHYPFEQLGVRRISLWVEDDNVDSIRFVEHLGFTQEATLAGAGSKGQDARLYVMLREGCRYV